MPAVEIERVCHILYSKKQRGFGFGKVLKDSLVLDSNLTLRSDLFANKPKSQHSYTLKNVNTDHLTSSATIPIRHMKLSRNPDVM